MAVTTTATRRRTTMATSVAALEPLSRPNSWRSWNIFFFYYLKIRNIFVVIVVIFLLLMSINVFNHLFSKVPGTCHVSGDLFFFYRCTVVQTPGKGFLDFFGKILINGYLGSEKIKRGPYFRVLMHFHDQAFWNIIGDT